MRVKKTSALALIITAAGLSLTACGGSSTTGHSSAPSPADSSAPALTSSSAGGQRAATGAASSHSAGGTGTAGTESKAGAQTRPTASGSRCRTEHLAFSAASAGVKNEIVVNLRNTGSGTCSMHGFPGVQLTGPDGLGDTGPDAARTDTTASTVTIAPGEETRFLLHYIPDTSGSGKTYTRLAVTPPGETVLDIVDLGGLKITVAASTGNAPDAYVDPVGYHTGTGK